MPVGTGEPAQQISFRRELARKATHMGALTIPIGYYVLNLQKWQMFAAMVAATGLMLVIDIGRLRNWALWSGFVKRLIAPIVREHEERGDFTGATYLLLSACATIALYDRPIAIAALAFIIVGDSFAAVIGRRFGAHRFRNKSLEGSLGCLLGTLIVAFASPGLPVHIAITGAVVATLVEAFPLGVDDNVSVPILSGLSMTIIQKTSLFC